MNKNYAKALYALCSLSLIAAAMPGLAQVAWAAETQDAMMLRYSQSLTFKPAAARPLSVVGLLDSRQTASFRTQKTDAQGYGADAPDAPDVPVAADLSANAAQSARPRSLEQAIQIALRKRLAIRIAQLATQSAQTKIDQAQASFKPTVRVLADALATNNYDTYSGTTSSVTVPGAGTYTAETIRSLPKYQITPSLRIDYDLYNGGRDQAMLAHTVVQKDSMDVQQSMTVRRVVLEVAQSYFQLRHACVRRAMAQSAVQLAQEKQTLAATRWSQGRIADIEYRTVANALSEHQLTLRLRTTDLESSYLQFSIAMNAVATANTEADTMCGFDSTQEQDLAAAAPYAEPGLDSKKNLLELQAAQKQIQIQQAAAKPKISLYAQYAGVGRTDSSNTTSVGNVHRRDASVGVSLSYTLFDGALVRHKIAESVLEAERLQLRHQEWDDERARAREKAQLKLKSAQLQQELAQSRLELAISQRQLAADKLNHGTGSTLALSEAQNREEVAMAELAIAHNEAALAQLDFLFPAVARQRTGAELTAP
ncbi:MAG: TolC family protein [Undibacterium curvum]|uniref:TolC family protein n=1 Tax=Undibacterium curvum TaxID=2762294 RepID=UPI003BC84269